ncbi:hypothetical protein JCM9279_003966 [Rhodotorula babjevae]
MSARARSARKSTASTFSYAEVPSSADEDEGSELDDKDRGGGGRQSSTKAPTKRRKSKAKAVEVDSGDEGDEDDQPRKKPRGSAKGKQSKQKKGTGKLEILKTLPIEMLTEIFSHLYPNDLLALSMVNKQYRALLIAKSSTRLWKAARDKLELPDVVTERFGEIEYASLLFGGKCQLCGVGHCFTLEPRLRVRYCKSCRTKEIVKLKTLKRTHPGMLLRLHPRAKDVVFQSDGKVLLGDLCRATVILRDLENQDEDSDIAENNFEPVRQPSPSSASPRRSSRTFLSKTWIPRQDDASDSDHDIISPYLRRVNEYVVARSSLFEEVNQHAPSMNKAFQMAQNHLQRVKYYGHSAADKPDPHRERELRMKVFRLHLGYSLHDFSGPWLRSKLVRSPNPLTDEEWVCIKPDLLELLARQKKLKDKQQLIGQDQRRKYDRQRDLRPHYDALLACLPKSARPFVPLIVDFLLFPSVKALWAGDDYITAQAWLDALGDIKDELEQFLLDLIKHAYAIVCEAMSDPEERSMAASPSSLAVDELGFNLDSFFSLATSFVCCDFRFCRRRPDRRKVRAHRGRFGAIGPLVDVLEHLHRHHNQDDTVYGECGVGSKPQFHITIPLEVACAVTAILEVHQLDPSTAGVPELERADKGVHKYVWDNHSASRRNYSGKRAWFELLWAVKKEGDKLAHLKTPVYLDPPVIVMHPIQKPRSGCGAGEDGEAEQLGASSESEEGVDRRGASGEEDLTSDEDDG